MKKAFVDVCQPLPDVGKEQRELEEKGYILTGQIGGGDLGSGLCYDLPETEEEEQEVHKLHAEHMEIVEEYHRWLESRSGT